MCQKDIVLICVYFNMRDQAAVVPILLPRKSSPLKMYKYQGAQKRYEYAFEQEGLWALVPKFCIFSE